ncbi:BTAD domain-containing putative transcriptional regulator [Amycolatopsis tucumanensis]|uniref:BTAD domain-containing putative transcriptional regulator n=1 Tax=Amycolatopsis tucumanensis TaxID=401106 RepID=UPI001F416653|nr:BTAD domain-containing putative transcriptional regulator [Amycolatopsis tucumanensis]MCF6421816.1 AAA family ATPase [Amycolatopsis tucumanensis]
MHRRAAVIGQQNVVSTPCRFTILGPPGLRCGDAELELGAPQQQAVLMLLLSRSGSFVRIGELIDGLWGDRAPATGEAVIRTYISRIRRVLSEHGLGSAIRSQSGGYMLDPSLFALDADEFTRLVETARQERANGDVPGAAKHLREALDLWTGTALAGVPGEAAERERSRLERLKLIATQELLQLRLEMGEHAEVVAEVPLLIQLNRLEEPLYEIYLLALYRSGRRAEALEVYRMVYDLLGKELGVSPGPRLRAIHEKILRADTDAEDEFVPAPRPRAVAPVTGEPAARPAGAALDRAVGSRFVGRDAERAAFAAMLGRRRGDGLVVFFVCGHAGVGKSTLLRRYADDAAAAGRTVWHLHDVSTAELRERLDQLAEGLTTASDGPVVLVDSFERHGELEPWLRDEYLRTLPADSIVVVASRLGPSVCWITDPGWSGSIVARQLEALSAAESAALVEARGVDPGFVPSIVDFAAGNPFVLSLAAEVGRSMSATGQPSRREAVRFVVDTVLDTLIGAVPSPQHRWALHVCAHARYTTEDLLRVAVPGGDAAELFDWLRVQPYVETPGHGLDINGVLREALEAHLRWRDPVGYERMHRRIRDYTMNTLLRDSTDPRASAAVLRTISHLRRRGGVTNRYVSATGEPDVRATGVTPADHDELVALAHETYGEFTASSVRFWLNRQPGGFHVLRCVHSGRLRAFMSWLTVREPAPEELDADPVIADVWHDVARRNLPPGAHFGIARHLICPAFESKPNPITDVFLARMMRGWVHEAGLAASYLVIANRQLWAPLMDYLDHYEVNCAGSSYPYAIFGHDWIADPPSSWQDRHLEDELWAPRRPDLFRREGR